VRGHDTKSVRHSSGTPILKNKSGRYLPSTLGSTPPRHGTASVTHSSGQNILKNRRGKYLPGTVKDFRRSAATAARATGRIVYSRVGTRAVAAATARTIAAQAARQAAPSLATASAVPSVPAIATTAAIVGAGAVAVYAYCTMGADGSK
jgi:hypothetical protein